MLEPTRLLARRSELGYVTHGGRALAGEPESVPVAVQADLTRRAGLIAQDRSRIAWAESQQRMRRELDYLYSQRFQRDVTTQLAALERQLDRLDARLR